IPSPLDALICFAYSARRATKKSRAICAQKGGFMAKISVQFRYLTGLKRDIFKNARLVGSWDSAGLFSPTWSETPMTAARAEDGCPSFGATVQFDTAEVGKKFQWGVRLDAPG